MSVILPTILTAIWERIISPRSLLYVAQKMTAVKTEIQPDSKAAAQISGKKKLKKQAKNTQRILNFSPKNHLLFHFMRLFHDVSHAHSHGYLLCLYMRR